MKQNLDTYFKEKLQYREFVMKDAYWQEAEAMLDEVDKRKRYGILFWWMGGLLTVALLMFMFISNENIFSQESIAATNIIKNEPTNSQPTNPIANNSTVNEISNTTEVKSLQTSNYKKEKNKIPIILNEQNIQHAKAILINNTQLIKENKLTETSNKIIAENKNTERAEAPELISQLQVLVNGHFEEAPELPFEDKNMCLEPSPFHIGISAAQFMQVAPKSGENLITGFYGGLVAQYDLNKKWFVSTGIGYMMRDGHFDASKTTETKGYRFGLELSGDQLQPTSLHYVSMPLLIGWKKGHHLLEGGVYLDYLAGVRGEIGKIERMNTEIPTKDFVAYEKGWLAEDGFTKFNISPAVGYRYRVNKELSFGLAAQYAIKRITDKTNPPDFILKENDRFQLRLQAVYLLK